MCTPMKHLSSYRNTPSAIKPEGVLCLWQSSPSRVLQAIRPLRFFEWVSIIKAQINTPPPGEAEKRVGALMYV